MKLPTIEHIEAIVLDCFGVREISKKVLFERLENKKASISKYKFNQAFKSLEKKRYIELDDFNENDKFPKYRITSKGVMELQHCYDFYVKRIGLKTI